MGAPGYGLAVVPFSAMRMAAEQLESAEFDGGNPLEAMAPGGESPGEALSAEVNS